MRAKIALLVVAAVVFAPAWTASEGGGAADDPIAARMLAPTVDEANVGSDAAVSKAKRLERANPRAGSWKTLPWRSTSSAPPSPAPSWGPVLLLVLAVAITFAPPAGSPRAPPHLRIV